MERHVDHLHDSNIPVTEPAATSTNSASDFKTISISHPSVHTSWRERCSHRSHRLLFSDTVAEPSQTAAVPPQLEITRSPNPPQASPTKDHSTTKSRYPSRSGKPPDRYSA